MLRLQGAPDPNEVLARQRDYEVRCSAVPRATGPGPISILVFQPPKGRSSNQRVGTHLDPTGNFNEVVGRAPPRPNGALAKPRPRPGGQNCKVIHKMRGGKGGGGSEEKSQERKPGESGEEGRAREEMLDHEREGRGVQGGNGLGPSRGTTSPMPVDHPCLNHGYLCVHDLHMLGLRATCVPAACGMHRQALPPSLSADNHYASNDPTP